MILYHHPSGFILPALSGAMTFKYSGAWLLLTPDDEMVVVPDTDVILPYQWKDVSLRADNTHLTTVCRAALKSFVSRNAILLP